LPAPKVGRVDKAAARAVAAVVDLGLAKVAAAVVKAKCSLRSAKMYKPTSL